MTAPGVVSYSDLVIHSEIGEVERFDRSEEVVSYAGLGSSHPRVWELAERVFNK